jgi:hypothetical protein
MGTPAARAVIGLIFAVDGMVAAAPPGHVRNLVGDLDHGSDACSFVLGHPCFMARQAVTPPKRACTERGARAAETLIGVADQRLGSAGRAKAAAFGIEAALVAPLDAFVEERPAEGAFLSAS